MNNYIFLIVGPSGSGKSTIAEHLVETMNLKQIESYTTRKPRSRHEKGHIFVTDKEFDNLIDLVGYTEFCGHRYAATAAQVEENDIYEQSYSLWCRRCKVSISGTQVFLYLR